MQYWDMTYYEISTYIKAYNNRQKYELQKQASMDYKLADLISISLSRLLDKNTKFPTVYEAYPSIFDDELIQQHKQQELEKQKQLNTERLKAMILAHSQDYKRR